MPQDMQQHRARLLTAVGWELLCTDGTSNKFYRLILAGPAVVISWGRIGAAGSVTVHRNATPPQAKYRALDLSEQKERKGYRLVREPVSFRVAAQLADDAESCGGNEDSAANVLVRHFTSLPDREGATR